jgi:hypothetical protein
MNNVGLMPSFIITAVKLCDYRTCFDALSSGRWLGWALYKVAYIVGNTKRVNSVAPKSPPAMAMAIGPQKILDTKGIIAKIAAAAVKSIGRNLVIVALMMASQRESPP